MVNIVVILSSVRPGRMAERVGKLIMKFLESKGAKPVLMDPLTITQELVAQPLHFLQSADQAPKWMGPTHDMIQKADGFFVLTAEYNCGVPPALSNLLNSFPPISFRHKPCGLVGYSMGPFAGMRALTVIKPFLGELGLLVLPTYVPIPTVQMLLDENGKTKEKMVLDRVDQAVEELVWYASGLKQMKSAKPPPG